MEKLLQYVQALSSDKLDDLRQLRIVLLKEENVILKHLNAVDDIVNGLDNNIHSLAISHFLAVKLFSPKLDLSKFFFVIKFKHLLIWEILCN